MANPGDSNRITREYFDSILLEMRHINAVLPDTALKLYGETFSTPIMTAALSHSNNVHPGGMVELARGAAAANAVMWAGMGDEMELDAMVATGAKTIKIIKPYADEGMIARKIAHAQSAGAFAVGMDLDHAFGHGGGYDCVLGHDMRPKTFGQIAEYVKSTKLPFIIKGVLSVQDARLCLEAGVAGIVVSHHHGIMSYAVPPLAILPKIVEAIGGRIPVFVDCGVESGMDVFKALALGATAVSIGRALMKPLEQNGAEGVKAAIEGYTRELSHAMAMTCSPAIDQVDSSVVWRD